MIVIPSVDILDGKTVRLFKGKFDSVTQYANHPFDMVQSYLDMGYTFVHIVNLDRAQGVPNSSTERIIEKICTLSNVHIQMGGGLRTSASIKEANDLGVKQFVIGTLPVVQRDLTLEMLHTYGKERFTFSFDVRKQENEYVVCTHGWQQNSVYTLLDLMHSYEGKISHLLCTDIDKDGTLGVPNFSLYQDIKRHFPDVFLQASGGVSREEDIYELAKRHIDGIVIGKAIHEKKINLLDLKKALSNLS